MKYKNANDIIPETLLAEVQKYAAGDLLIFRSSKNGERAGAKAAGPGSILESATKRFETGLTKGRRWMSFPTHTVSLRTASERSYMQNQTSAAGPQILRKKNKAFPAVAQYSWESLFPWNRKFNYT
ncbi:MAG: hypothetical protein ACLTXL_06095 [Clostridia bacterium]